MGTPSDSLNWAFLNCKQVDDLFGQHKHVFAETAASATPHDRHDRDNDGDRRDDRHQQHDLDGHVVGGDRCGATWLICGDSEG